MRTTPLGGNFELYNVGPSPIPEADYEFIANGGNGGSGAAGGTGVVRGVSVVMAAMGMVGAVAGEPGREAPMANVEIRPQTAQTAAQEKPLSRISIWKYRFKRCRFNREDINRSRVLSCKQRVTSTMQ